MGVIKTLTTIAILFVAFNLEMTVYNSINRAWRERFENPPHLFLVHVDRNADRVLDHALQQGDLAGTQDQVTQGKHAL